MFIGHVCERYFIMCITCFWYKDDVLYEEITERKIKEKGGQSNYEH